MTSSARRASSVTQDKLIASLRADNERLRSQLAPPHFVPVEAAEARGFSPETIRRWCHRGLVKHRWDGMRLLVSRRSDYDRLIQSENG